MRAVLLSNDEVSEYLNENFVLAWSSVRPVPKVTIDFGNGKTLKRTLKGNTIFHLLRADGTVLDSLPGVYQPKDFLAELKKSAATLKLSDEEILAWHEAGGVSLGTDAMMGKGAVQGPILMLLEPAELDLTTNRGKLGVQGPMLMALDQPEPETPKESEVVDVSAKPMTLEEVRSTYLDNREDIGKAAMEKDSEASLNVLRPAVHRWFAQLKGLPTVAESRTPLFQDILKVKIYDPYMGLKVQGIPGTD